MTDNTDRLGHFEKDFGRLRLDESVKKPDRWPRRIEATTQFCQQSTSTGLMDRGSRTDLRVDVDSRRRRNGSLCSNSTTTLSALFVVFLSILPMRFVEAMPLQEEYRHLSPFKKYQQMIIAEQEIRWPFADPPDPYELINRVDCYEELDEEFINFTMALPNDGQLAYRPCMIRIPTQHQITFIHLNLTDMRSNVKIVSGNAMDHAPLKTTTVTGRTPRSQLGPYYVPCQWAYLIFESYTVSTRETVYFRLDPPPPDMDVDMMELSVMDACMKPTRNHAARHFYKPITPKPLSLEQKSEVETRYSPERYIEMD